MSSEYFFLARKKLVQEKNKMRNHSAWEDIWLLSFLAISCVVLMENNFPPLSSLHHTDNSHVFSIAFSLCLSQTRKIHGFNHRKTFFFYIFLCTAKEKLGTIIFAEFSFALPTALKYHSDSLTNLSSLFLSRLLHKDFFLFLSLFIVFFHTHLSATFLSFFPNRTTNLSKLRLIS